MKYRYRALAAAGVAALVAAGCGSSSKSSGGGGGGANQASAPGLTASTITIGLVTELTGAASTEYINTPKAVQARIDAQNAAGGVDGRQLKLVVEDDQTTPAGNQTASQLLIQKGVFAVINESALTFAGARVLQQAGVPVIGNGVDGNEWGEQPYTNMFTFSGTGSTATGTDPHGPQYTVFGNFIKGQGATSLASFGYSIPPSSAQAAKGAAESARAAGVKVGLVDTSIPLGSVNATPIALQIKQSGADALQLAMDNNTNFAIITAAKQAGANLKAAVAAAGYGQTLLDDPSAVAAAQGVYFESLFAPEGPAVDAMKATFTKYAGFSGVPDIQWASGYVGADLVIKGLELAGKNPTRQSFMNGLRGVTNYTAGGLLPNPANFSLSEFGTSPDTACGYFTKLQGSTFVPVPADGKPVCGTKIPNSNVA